MKNLLTEILLIIFLIPAPVFAREYLYILNDKCINDLYNAAQEALEKSNIAVIRDPHGIILRFKLENPDEEFENISSQTYNKISTAAFFLAKIKNPAIIEVHTENISQEKLKGHKNWEVSTVIANKLESIMSKELNYDRIYSVGYGEFLPAKNTPYNGVNYQNRVDIIIICNVSGE